MDADMLLGPELPINLCLVMHHEVATAAKALKNNRACRVHEVPAEFWKAFGR